MPAYSGNLPDNQRKMFALGKLNIKGRWNELKWKVRQAYASITYDDLRYEEGQEDQLIGRLQQKTGRSREELVKWINSL